MRYLCSLYAPAAWGVGGGGVGEGGESFRGDRALCGAEAVAVRVRNGRLEVSPAVATEAGGALPEHFLLEAWDLNDAIRLVSHHPCAASGRVELRPIRPLVLPPGSGGWHAARDP